MRERPTRPEDARSAGRHDGHGVHDGQAARAGTKATTEPWACSTCGSTSRCERRLPTTDGGWVCRDAVAMGLFRINGEHSIPRRRPESEAGG